MSERSSYEHINSHNYDVSNFLLQACVKKCYSEPKLYLNYIASTIFLKNLTVLKQKFEISGINLWTRFPYFPFLRFLKINSDAKIVETFLLSETLVQKFSWN